MEHVGIDLAKNKSQVCILTEHGEVIERRIATTREPFTERVTPPRPSALDAPTPTPPTSEIARSIASRPPWHDPGGRERRGRGRLERLSAQLSAYGSVNYGSDDGAFTEFVHDECISNIAPTMVGAVRTASRRSAA